MPQLPTMHASPTPDATSLTPYHTCSEKGNSRPSAGACCAWAGTGSLASGVVGALTWSLFVATIEEVVFRGMITRELAARWGWPLAAAAGGLVFAGMHLLAMLPVLRPTDAAWSAIAAVVASALFTALHDRTGSLWLPIGCHWGWDFVLSGVFGATMSGHASPPAILSTVMDGPLAVSGGGFGLEASIVAMVLMALAAALAAVLPRSAGAGIQARARQRCPDAVG